MPLNLKKKMRKAIVITLICFAFSANIFAQEKKETKVINLTYNEFVKKVWNFEKSPDTFKYEGELPCVVDFYATWCGPCRKVSPIMEKIAKEYDGMLIIYKIDVDKEPKLASTFSVRSIPTVLFIPKEGQPSKQVGALSEQQYKQIIENNLLK